MKKRISIGLVSVAVLTLSFTLSSKPSKQEKDQAKVQASQNAPLGGILRED